MVWVTVAILYWDLTLVAKDVGCNNNSIDIDTLYVNMSEAATMHHTRSGLLLHPVVYFGDVKRIYTRRGMDPSHQPTSQVRPMGQKAAASAA